MPCNLIDPIGGSQKSDTAQNLIQVKPDPPSARWRGWPSDYVAIVKV